MVECFKIITCHAVGDNANKISTRLIMCVLHVRLYDEDPVIDRPVNKASDHAGMFTPPSQHDLSESGFRNILRSNKDILSHSVSVLGSFVSSVQALRLVALNE